MYRKGGSSYATLSVHRNDKMKGKAKHLSCSKGQTGSISQKLKEMQRNLLLGLSICHLNLPHAASVTASFTQTTSSFSEGLKYFPTCNKDNLRGGRQPSQV